MTFNLQTNDSSFDSPTVECIYRELRKLEKEESGFLTLDNGKGIVQTYCARSGFALEKSDHVDLFRSKYVVPFEIVFLVFVEFLMGINNGTVEWKLDKDFHKSVDYRELWIKKGFHRENE